MLFIDLERENPRRIPQNSGFLKNPNPDTNNDTIAKLRPALNSTQYVLSTDMPSVVLGQIFVNFAFWAEFFTRAKQHHGAAHMLTKASEAQKVLCTKTKALGMFFSVRVLKSAELRVLGGFAGVYQRGKR